MLMQRRRPTGKARREIETRSGVSETIIESARHRLFRSSGSASVPLFSRRQYALALSHNAPLDHSIPEKTWQRQMAEKHRPESFSTRPQKVTRHNSRRQFWPHAITSQRGLSSPATLPVPRPRTQQRCSYSACRTQYGKSAARAPPAAHR